MEDLSEEIENALDLLEAAYKQPSNKKKVILDKGKTVYLQIVLFKIPFAAPRKRKYLRLRHSLYGNDPEVCLFVPNRKTGVEYKKTTEELIDFCVDHYTGILEKHKVKGITTVMPVKQLKSEYGTYELRRKLVHRFDLFLCKNSLLYNCRFLTGLGKVFRVANKEPLGVPFPKEDVDYDPEFQKNIERAIFTSSFYINRFSDNYSIPFGSLSNTKTELRDNLQAVLQQISSENIIPGGIKNIRAMYVWPSQSKPVPLYINPELPIDMKKPCEKSKRKRLRGVEGEISTQPYKKVFVTPRGEVFVTKIDSGLGESELFDSDDEDSFLDDSDNGENGDSDGDADRKESFKSKHATDGDKAESDSEGDDEIEEQEARLLEMKRRTESDSYSGKKSFQDAQEGNQDNVKVTKKQKMKSKENRRTDRDGEEINSLKRSNKDKAKEKGRKINKTERKTQIKQKKFNQKGKSKQKRI